MASTPGNRPLYSSGSPFKPDILPVVEDFALDDRVTHDAFGLGRVVGVYTGGVTVDFRGQRAHVASPFRRMTKL